MLWAALLLASTPPAPLPPDPSSAPLALAATARTFNIEVGRAVVDVTIDVAAVARPSRVPVRVAARSATTRDVPDEPLVVYVCDDVRCTLRSEVHVPLDGAPVMLEASLFPTGLALSLRHRDQETRCCGTSAYGRNIPVIATTDPAGPHVDVLREGSAAALVVVPVGETLRSRPSLIEAYNAIIVADGDPDSCGAGLVPAIRIAGTSPAPHDPGASRDAPHVREFVKRGGIASVPATFFGGTAHLPDVPSLAAVDVSFGSGPSHALRVPDGTKVVHDGAGTYVVRPLGASREEQVAGVVAAQPGFLQWTSRYAYEDSIPVRAAGAGLASRPHRGVAFLIGFVSVVGIALCVRTSRRRGWRAALASSALVAFGALAALWLVERASMPDETRTRVVAWLGPGASWETGVDAVRPRSAREVTVSSPVPPVMATILGEEIAPREPQRGARVDERGETSWSVTSKVSSSAALAVTWERPAPPRARAPVTVADGVVTNHLDVPLRAVTMQRFNRFTGPLAPNESRARHAFGTVMNPDDPLLDLTVMEQRLLRDIGEACTARLGPTHTDEDCGAAIAVLEDGTLLGIEVSP